MRTYDLLPFLLVFARTAGMIGLNPIFNRRNLPSRARAGLIFWLTLLLIPLAGPAPSIRGTGGLGLLLTLAQELLVGAVCGLIFQVFYYLLFFAGDAIDTQLGLSMARVFDPGTSIQVSVTGNFLNLLFLLYFFATDCHLVLLHLFAASFQLVPLGTASLVEGLPGFAIELFTSAFSLVMRLALPFIMAELVLEISMGILMKLVPQIHVFVINIQMKVLLGFVMLFAFSQPVADFVDQYLQVVLKSLQQALILIAG